jgi:hypothetical protein
MYLARPIGILFKCAEHFCYRNRCLTLTPRIVIRSGSDQRIATIVINIKLDSYIPGTQTHLNSASLANLASGNTLMLMMSPPQARYMWLSARVENWGPSMQTTHLAVWS